MAKLFFRYGAMNSGKSTALMQVAYNYEERGMKVLLLKPRIDKKAEDYILSRLGVKRKVDYLVDEEDDLYQMIFEKTKDEMISCILVDEAQFLKRDQVDQLFRITVDENLPVICYGLRTDFLMNGFEGATRLLEIAHSLEELKTICRCGRKAMFNGRKMGEHFIFSGDQVAIDGMENITYESLCGKCYFRELGKNESKD